ncbi:MAG: MBOAT family O-acyltransferase [Burkholderiales bacterium]
MLFTSAEFAFIFLPATLLAFFAAGRWLGCLAAAGLLGLLSLVFYAVWAPASVLLLGGSIAFNFLVGRYLCTTRTAVSRYAYPILIGAVAINLTALGYFKYLNFLVATVNGFGHISLPVMEIVLPIGISFFTFTQIAFLVDTYRGVVGRTSPVHFLLFVTYFPHLIAGPVLHHAEVIPQFARPDTCRPQIANITTGLLFFAIGLAKKVFLADSMQPYAAVVFDSAADAPPTLVEAWAGALAYTLQLYFDFSGYSDMAVGLSRLFNVRLPYNFDSPYQARNIIDFWRRWHMTLSRFLRDYLYISLGGNRRGPIRRYANLFATMVLGGLWHGAGWGFIVWGALHGTYLMINHGWNACAGAVPGRRIFLRPVTRRLGTPAAILITFLCVVIAWVFFRATSLESAWRMIEGMFGAHGVWPVCTPEAPTSLSLCPSEVHAVRLDGWRQLAWTIALLILVFFAPNSQRLIGDQAPVLARKVLGANCSIAQWQFAAVGGLLPLIGLLIAIAASRGLSEFIYYNF